MDNNVRLGDGVSNEIKTTINNQIKELLNSAIIAVFNTLETKLDNLPEKIEIIEIIKRFLNNPETEQEVIAQWSKYLVAEGLVSKGYKGLSDDLLVSNLHQEGYLSGLYAGYLLAMMAMVDNDVPKDTILAVRDNIRPNLIGHHYNNSEEFTNQYQNERYSWIDKAK